MLKGWGAGAAVSCCGASVGTGFPLRGPGGQVHLSVPWSHRVGCPGLWWACPRTWSPGQGAGDAVGWVNSHGGVVPVRFHGPRPGVGTVGVVSFESDEPRPFEESAALGVSAPGAEVPSSPLLVR